MTTHQPAAVGVPAPIWKVLNEDVEVIVAEAQKTLGQLTAKIVLARLAVRRREDCELAEARLEFLCESLHHAAEDARAAQRALASGR